MRSSTARISWILKHCSEDQHTTHLFLCSASPPILPTTTNPPLPLHPLPPLPQTHISPHAPMERAPRRPSGRARGNRNRDRLTQGDSIEPKIVMADSHTSRNVESPLARSVVDPSTTGVDASKSQDTSVATGDSSKNSASTVTTLTNTSTTLNNENSKNNESAEYGAEAVSSHELWGLLWLQC
jgi:hypothetical protein